MADVRIKLHANLNNDVQNIWMSLNYDRKPTIGHVMSQLKQNFNCDDEINLYLDGFWLPPYESSRLLRENDYIKIEINKSKTEDNVSNKKSFLEPATSLPKRIESTNYYEPIKQNLQHETKLKEKNNLKTTSTNDLSAKPLNKEKQPSSAINEVKKFVLNKLTKSPSSSSTSSSSNSSASEPINNNKNKASKQTNESQAKSSKNQAPKAPNSKISNDLNKNVKPVNMTSHKKFSVASYVHLLNEDDDQNEQNGHWYEENDKQDTNINKKVSAPSFNNNIEKIAQTINATAKTKWRNSNTVDKQSQQQQQGTKTMPQHIRFESSTSSDDDSSSDSSSESTTTANSEDVSSAKNKKQAAKKASNDNANKNKKSPQQQQQQKKQQNAWKPLNKEEQLNMNKKPAKDVKKAFNKTKVNAPVDGDEEYYYQEDGHNIVEEIKDKSKKVFIDFEKLESLNGTPNVNDEIAFQILEISSNFTPEISEYKTGVVVSYDAQAKEVTLKLTESSYNEVLNKPNKFTVIEDENEYDEDGELMQSKKQEEEKTEEDEIITIDWTSLINVKKMVRNEKQQNECEPVKEKEQELMVVEQKEEQKEKVVKDGEEQAQVENPSQNETADQTQTQN